MKRVTRKQIRSWLAPMRSCFAQMRSGSVDSIRGYAVTRLDHTDEYARIDHCIAGFRALIDRLCPEINTLSIQMVEKKLAAGIPLTVDQIDAALTLISRCEDALVKKTVAELKDAVVTEQILIELDEIAAERKAA